MGSKGIKSLKPIRHISDLFPSSKSYRAFRALADEMKNRGNRLSTNAVSELSKKLHQEKVYNRGNFYWYVLQPLVELGFIERVPFWNENLKRTQYCYTVVKYDLPRYPISSGYLRDAYFLCREWNEFFFDDTQNSQGFFKNNWQEPSKKVISDIGLVPLKERVARVASKPKTGEILSRSRRIS
jgi:hypothetical protein